MVKYLKFDMIKTPETVLEFRDTTDATTVNRFSGVPDNVVSVVGDELEIAKLIAAQPLEINTQEISREVFQTAVADSDQIAEINRQVKVLIARRYDTADEIAMLKRSSDDSKRVDYEAFIADCLAQGKSLKLEMGFVDRADEIVAIKKEYAALANQPVEINGVIWTGGDSSASAISGAVSLAQALGETAVTLWDANNVNHPDVPFEQAQAIAAQIAMVWREVMYARNQVIADKLIEV